MNIAEGQRLKQLEARVESLERALQDAVRRLDDLSAADRTLKLKKQANG
jgi:hypothetical protein